MKHFKIKLMEISLCKVYLLCPCIYSDMRPDHIRIEKLSLTEGVGLALLCTDMINNQLEVMEILRTSYQKLPAVKLAN